MLFVLNYKQYDPLANGLCDLNCNNYLDLIRICGFVFLILGGVEMIPNKENVNGVDPNNRFSTSSIVSINDFSLYNRQSPCLAET